MLQEVSSTERSHRLAIVTGGLPLGGSTTFICNLAGELIRRGISTRVLSFEKENPLSSDFDTAKIPVTCYDENKLIYEDRMLCALNELAKFRPTMVLANLGGTSFEVLRYVPMGVFRIGVVHTDDPKIYKAIPAYAPYLDAIIAVSKTIESQLKILPLPEKILVQNVPLGVPMPESISRVSPMAEPLRILYLGRLDHEQKRVRLFPAILEQLKSTGMRFSWTIVGEGTDKEFLEQNLKSSPGQNVRLAGKISYANVPQCLDEHDVFLLASDYEGLPLTLLEAMGHGLVPVVSDLPSGISEVVNETTGIKVPVQDTAGYAKAIFWLHEHREEMRRMSDAAREKVKTDFSVSAMTDRWMTVFSKGRNDSSPWPTKWDVKPILNVGHPVYYSRPIRAIRRLAKKWMPV